MTVWSRDVIMTSRAGHCPQMTFQAGIEADERHLSHGGSDEDTGRVLDFSVIILFFLQVSVVRLLDEFWRDFFPNHSIDTLGIS